MKEKVLFGLLIGIVGGLGVVSFLMGSFPTMEAVQELNPLQQLLFLCIMISTPISTVWVMTKGGAS